MAKANDYKVTAFKETTMIPTKEKMQSMLDALLSNVDEGWVDPMQAYGLAAAMEKLFGEAKKRLSAQAVAEAEKYPEKDIFRFGGVFTLKESGAKYDYSNDKEWRDYEENIKALRTEQKARELILKAGNQCSKSSTTILQVTFRDDKV